MKTKLYYIISLMIGSISVICFFFTRWNSKVRKYLQYKKVCDLIIDFSNEIYIEFYGKLIKVNPDRSFKYMNETYLITRKREEALVAENTDDVYGLPDNTSNNNLLDFQYNIERVCVNTSKNITEMLSYHSIIVGDEKVWMPKTIKKEFFNLLGKNIQEIPPPNFPNILVDHLLSPFFLLSTFSSVLWLFDEYFYTTITNLGMSIFIEIGNAYQKYCNLKIFSRRGDRCTLDVLEMKNQEEFPEEEYLAKLIEKGVLVKKKSIDLKPGDIIELNEKSVTEIKKFPCDFILLEGTVIVNESLLTGESVPISKIPLSKTDDDVTADVKDKEMKNMKTHIIYGNSSPISISGNTRLMVLNIGFSTESGKLIKKMIQKEHLNIDYRDSLSFILLLLVIGGFFSIYIIKKFISFTKLRTEIFQDHKFSNECLRNIWNIDNLKRRISRYVEGSILSGNVIPNEIDEKDSPFIKGIFKCSCYSVLASLGIRKFNITFNDLLIDLLMLLTNIVPAELPLELSITINTCVSELLLKKIFVIEPKKLINASDIDIVCLDKTGTITEDKLVVKGIWQSNKDDDLAVTLLSGCHQLSVLNPGESSENISENIDSPKIVGDPIDLAIAEHLETEHPENGKTIYDDDMELKTLKIIPFSSDSKAQSSILQLENKIYLVTKGAREIIVKKCDPKSISRNDHLAYEYQSAEGLRVLGFCYKELKSVDEVVKDGEMFYGGIVLMENPVKKNAKEEVELLKNAGFSVVMITGDSKLTSTAIAKQVSIISGDSKNIDNEQVLDGMEIQKLLNSTPSKETLQNIKVFSRVSPTMKEDIVKTYQMANMNCLMVGDGTNDVGALKEAKVGIALLTPMPEKEKKKRKTMAQVREEKLTELKSYLGLLSLNETETSMLGDASIAAPISTRKGLETISTILSYGRSLAVTNLQMYKILCVNSVVFAFFWVFETEEVKFGDKQMLVTSFLLSMAFLALTLQSPVDLRTTTNENKKTAVKAPKVRSSYAFSSIISQIIVHTVTLFISLNLFSSSIPNDRQLSLVKNINIICSDMNSIKNIGDEEIIKQIGEIAKDTCFEKSRSNTALFILTQYLQIQTFFINYMGLPYREPLYKNLRLFGCLILCVFSLIVSLFGLYGDIVDLMECIPMSWKDIGLILGICAGNGLMCWICDRVSFCMLHK